MLDRERNGRRSEPMRGGRERHRRTGRVLVEDVEDDPALQRVTEAAFPIRSEMTLRAVEDRGDLRVSQRIDGEEIHERVAYCGSGRFASASIAPWRMCAAASASTFSARLARL